MAFDKKIRQLRGAENPNRDVEKAAEAATKYKVAGTWRSFRLAIGFVLGVGVVGHNTFVPPDLRDWKSVVPRVCHLLAAAGFLATGPRQDLLRKIQKNATEDDLKKILFECAEESSTQNEIKYLQEIADTFGLNITLKLPAYLSQE